MSESSVLEMEVGSSALDIVRLPPVMARSEGRAEVIVGMIDGPIAENHPDLRGRVRSLQGDGLVGCGPGGGGACLHGTFVAGILAGRRGSPAPSIAPGCTLLSRPIFADTLGTDTVTPADDLARALSECLTAGARIVNLSVAVTSRTGTEALIRTLDAAAQRGVLIVAAAGNQSTLATSPLTRHPWVVPVAACGSDGRPLPQSNLAAGIGRRGLLAPGESIVSLAPDGGSAAFGGTSAAAPFVTGAAALLLSLHPRTRPESIRAALLTATGSVRRTGLVPPLLDAWAAHRLLSNT